MKIPRVPALIASAFLLSGSALNAALVYYMPFDQGTSASLVNSGTAGGTATSVASSFNITPAPAASSSPVKFGTYSEYFTTNPTNTVYGGAVLLPNSSSNFRLDNSSSLMTISTWVYWNGTAGSNTRYGIANLFPSNNGAGWTFNIGNDGALYYSFVTSASASRSRNTTSVAVTTGSWVNVALTVDTSLASNSAISIYANGVQQLLTGSALSTAVTLTNSGDIALGVQNHTSGGGGSFALNGYLDDYAMWDTALTAAKIKSINTAPALLSGYNAGIMNGLFTAFDTLGSQAVGSLLWGYAANFDVTGHVLGDTWLGVDGKYNMWLAGTSGSALGLQGVTAIPEPSVAGLLLGGGLILFAVRRFRRLNCSSH